MSKQTDYLRWVMQCGKERRYDSEDYFWAVLENAIADVDERMVELPLDEDNVPIRVGDVLDGYGKSVKVVEMRYGHIGWVLISRDGNGYADTSAFTHHTTTVEGVLRDFQQDTINTYNRIIDPEEYRRELERIVEETAEEIRGMM